MVHFKLLSLLVGKLYFKKETGNKNYYIFNTLDAYQEQRIIITQDFVNVYNCFKVDSEFFASCSKVKIDVEIEECQPKLKVQELNTQSQFGLRFNSNGFLNQVFIDDYVKTQCESLSNVSIIHIE